MKLKWNEKYTTVALYAFFVLAGGIGVFFLLWNTPALFSAIGGFLRIINPFLWAFAMAYVLNQPLRFFEKKVYAFLNKKKPRPRLVKGLSVATVYIIFLSFIIGLILIIIPELGSSISRFAESLPDYIEQLDLWWNGLTATFGLGELLGDAISLDTIFLSLIDQVKNLAPMLASTGINMTVQAVTTLGNMALSIVASIYLLYSKDKFILQVKKATYALFPKKFAERSIMLTRESNEIFSAYVSSKLTEGLIIGLLNFISMTIMRMPYVLLISVIMGIAEVIPVFGPFIGAVPSAVLLFLVDPKYALWFIILTVVMQQIDSQFIGPKILGDSTGLTAFWVMFAIILGGGLLGTPGIVLGIPLFAVLYSVVRSYINYRLEKRNLSTTAEDYRSYKN